MTKYCSDCDKLDAKKKSAGKTSGNLYYCKKIKKYINPTQIGCENFENCYKRGWYEKNQIYDDGKAYDNSSGSWQFYGIVFIILVILGIILGVFKM